MVWFMRYPELVRAEVGLSFLRYQLLFTQTCFHIQCFRLLLVSCFLLLFSCWLSCWLKDISGHLFLKEWSQNRNLNQLISHQRWILGWSEPFEHMLPFPYTINGAENIKTAWKRLFMSLRNYPIFYTERTTTDCCDVKISVQLHTSPNNSIKSGCFWS